MLRTLTLTRPWAPAARIGAALAFTALTALAARMAIPLEPVPFTLQPLAVLLAGLILGRRDGALSQAAYVGLIAAGLPLDARGLGTAALFGPTGGYLIGFIAAAFVTGWLAENAQRPLWRWLAGAAGVLVIYAVGVPWLAVAAKLDLAAAWAAGAAPFLAFDLAKAAIAAAVAETGRRLIR